MIRFIDNTGDYFVSNFFDEDFAAKVARKSGFGQDDLKQLASRITPLKDQYFKYKQVILEQTFRTRDKIYETHNWHTRILQALGYSDAAQAYTTPFHFSEKDVIPVRHILYRGDNKPHLFIMEMQPLIKDGDNEPDGLFEQRYNIEDDGPATRQQRYYRGQWDRVFTISADLHISPIIINKAISELCLLPQDERPEYILMMAGNMLFLINQEKWFKGAYLKLDLEQLFTEGTVNRQVYSLFYLLLAKDMLSPASEMVLMEQLDEDSHKSAYAVTQDLKEGVIYAVEALANEALYYWKQVQQRDFDETDDKFERDVRDDCITLIYRLLFVFYAEAREDLGLLPINDPVYQRGYSLEMLRDMEQTPLITDQSRNGYFFDISLKQLFALLSHGYRQTENGDNRSFRVMAIDSPLFDDQRLKQMHKVQFRNFVWQDVICRLSLSRQQRGRARGRISYANLGINQLGSVYESLLSYRGFYAEQDYIEVHPAGKPEEGTLLVPRSRRDDFADNEVLTDPQGNMLVIPRGRFVYRMSGRDRQKSASYYTPEVLTQTTVQYTLKPLLERVEKGEMSAAELLEVKLLEPAMGAAAFQNEMINQLAEAYLQYRQEEKQERITPDKYQEELQKVKAYIATTNTYGVDLNPTAIELGKLSLWLNAIHRDMETPFFSNRLAVGNATMGAWMKVYKENNFLHSKDDRKSRKEWWNEPPRHLNWKPGNALEGTYHDRRKDEVYHFLLPDGNMVPAADHKELKDKYPQEVRFVKLWRTAFTQPISQNNRELLQLLCTRIDNLLEDYYKFQRSLQLDTGFREKLFGYETAPQGKLHLPTYDEKERLDAQRLRHNAPYYKLKMVMDYWCSLWCWPLDKAEQLPTYHEFLTEVNQIVSLGLTDNDLATGKGGGGRHNTHPEAIQLDLAMEEERVTQGQRTLTDTLTEQGTEQRLFSQNRRYGIVTALAGQYRFFHPQLEFLEVFRERGGFDLIAGNPPWIKLEFEAKGIVAERHPEVLIRKVSAPQVRTMLDRLTRANPDLARLYEEELLEAQHLSTFLNARQNYPLLVGQQTNLYKCILENTFRLMNTRGFTGLIHPESIYDDPNGSVLRKEVYPRLVYHFQFKNELSLFTEVHHETIYGIQVYKGENHQVKFYSISNLFHPGTIDGSFTHTGHGIPGGYKVFDVNAGKMVWNIQPHRDRIIPIGEAELKLLARTFEDSNDWEGAKLVSIHTRQIISVLEKLSRFPTRVKDFESKTTVCWDETNAVNAGIIRRNTRYPAPGNYELIYSGPHFFVANPLYKTPREVCELNSHYDEIDLTQIPADYLPRTNYVPAEDIDTYRQRIRGFSEDRPWIEEYKVCFSRRLSIAGERTIQPAIIPPKITHVHTVISTIFIDSSMVVELAGITSSLPIDFYIKTTGRGDLTSGPISNLQLGVLKQIRPFIISRTLLVNCLTIDYQPLWQSQWQDVFTTDSWAKQDARLKPFHTLTREWTWHTPLRNYYERRQALVEIDVLVAMALGLTLEELILIYEVQFPVLQQNEADTWYDQQGNIVFTCSKGLTGVGLDRAEWNQIKDLPAGDTYTHTITKSELYYGREVTYHAPFTKCDRVEDYKEVWKVFEERFNND